LALHEVSQPLFQFNLRISQEMWTLCSQKCWYHLGNFFSEVTFKHVDVMVGNESLKSQEIVIARALGGLIP